jgi:hypothetical protein
MCAVTLGAGRVYHDFRRAHIQAYFDEFVFCWNQRRDYRSSFDTLLWFGLRMAPIGRTSPKAKTCQS